MVVAAAVVGYSWAVASTRPFTVGADLLTAVPLAGALGMVAWQAIDRSRRGLKLAGPAEETAPQLGRQGGPRGWWSRLPPSQTPWVGTALPWLALLVLVVAWELYCYLAVPRAQHPTVSSIYDAAARWEVLKAALFAGWLALGYYLVRR